MSYQKQPANKVLIGHPRRANVKGRKTSQTRFIFWCASSLMADVFTSTDRSGTPWNDISILTWKLHWFWLFWKYDQNSAAQPLQFEQLCYWPTTEPLMSLGVRVGRFVGLECCYSRRTSKEKRENDNKVFGFSNISNVWLRKLRRKRGDDFLPQLTVAADQPASWRLIIGWSCTTGSNFTFLRTNLLSCCQTEICTEI